MRVGEVSGLNLEDFGVAESVFRVKGKGGRDRLAFLVDEQSRRIQQEHLELRSGIASSSHALFLNASQGCRRRALRISFLNFGKTPESKGISPRICCDTL
jgi:site-specific recombinase XerC